MKRYALKNLNERRLLELGDLDMRKVVARDESKSAADYFSDIGRFMESSLKFKGTLLAISGLERDVKFSRRPNVRHVATSEAAEGSASWLETLAQIKSSLTDIGCDKLDSKINLICEALEDGDLHASGQLAIEVYVAFCTLIDRIEIAYSVKKFTDSKLTDEDIPTESVLLKDVLERLDYVEASRKLRVLAVDDIPIVLNTITSVLGPHYEVFALRKSAQVKKFLAHTTPELFLLDLAIDEMSGFDLIRLIRSYEEHKNTPILVLTDNASYDNFKEALSLGARDFITKPVKQEMLLEKIAENIVRKKAY